MKFRPHRDGQMVRTCPSVDHYTMTYDPTACEDCGHPIGQNGGTHMHIESDQYGTYNETTKCHRVLICIPCLDRYREYVALEWVAGV